MSLGCGKKLEETPYIVSLWGNSTNQHTTNITSGHSCWPTELTLKTIFNIKSLIPFQISPCVTLQYHTSFHLNLGTENNLLWMLLLTEVTLSKVLKMFIMQKQAYRIKKIFLLRRRQPRGTAHWDNREGNLCSCGVHCILSAFQLRAQCNLHFHNCIRGPFGMK